jgi:hypothetical protein
MIIEEKAGCGLKSEVRGLLYPKPSDRRRWVLGKAICHVGLRIGRSELNRGVLSRKGNYILVTFEENKEERVDIKTHLYPSPTDNRTESMVVDIDVLGSHPFEDRD